MGKCVENFWVGWVLSSLLRKKRHRGTKRTGGLEKDGVGHNMPHLKSVTLQMANKFTELMKCLLKELSEWACWHRVKQKPRVFHLRRTGGFPHLSGLHKGWGRKDWGSDKLISFTKTVLLGCIHASPAETDWTWGCLPLMSIVFTLFHMLHSKNAFSPLQGQLFQWCAPYDCITNSS